VSPDGSRVVVAGRHGLIAFISADGAIAWRHTDPARDYRDCCFTPSGREVVASSYAESVDRFDAASGARIATIVGAYSQVWASAVSPEGTAIASGTFNARVEVFAANATSTLDAVPLDGSAVRSVLEHAAPDRMRAATVYATTADGALFAIDPQGAASRIPLDGESGPLHANWACVHDGDTLIVAHDSGLAWFSTSERRLTRLLATPAPAARVGTIEGGRTVVVRLTNGLALALAANDGRELWRAEGFALDSHLPVETAVPRSMLFPRGTGSAPRWVSIDDLIGSLDDEDFSAPTACPGWDVAAVLAHVIGTELMMAGEAPPAVDVPDLPHLRNDIARANEAWILARRDRTPDDLRSEFREVVARRTDELEGLTQQDVDAESWTPAGMATLGRFLQIRVFDTWIHELDIRDAVGRVGHETGPAVQRTLAEVGNGIGFVVGKRAGAPDGSWVRIDLPGPEPARYDIVVEGRARVGEIGRAHV
jgi:uncharacterized protein (TIGR03083 family)